MLWRRAERSLLPQVQLRTTICPKPAVFRFTTTAFSVSSPAASPIPHRHRTGRLTGLCCHDLRVTWIKVRETYAGSASLSRPDAPGPVARQSQDGWGRIRKQELPEGDKYAIRPPSWIHSGFVWSLLPVFVTQSRGSYRVLTVAAS